MDIIPLIERIGEGPTAALFGLITGITFGIAAQRSRFCLRAATVEFARGMMRDKIAVWLLTFSTAVIWVQAAQIFGFVDLSNARNLAVPGSWSGAIIGGLMFGAGMVLARGCSGRLLVLAATGNLRSVVSGLIFAVVAQMSLTGWLALPRDWLAALSVTSGGRNMDLLGAFHLPKESGLIIGLCVAIIALELSRRQKIGASRLIFASGVGFAAALGYGLTYTLSQSAFDPVQIESLTFTGPSANMLMFFLDRNSLLEFDIGLVPGVVLGSFLSALVGRELKFQGFEGPTPMRNAMVGAALMGFGGMLAGGCAIGAGVSGGAVFAGTAWLALFCMWIGGMVTDIALGGRGQPAMV